MTTWQWLIGLTGVMSIWVIPPAWADAVEHDGNSPISEIPGLRDLEASATTVDEWVSQVQAQESIPTSVQIIDVRVDPVETGIEIVLETTGELEAPSPSTVGNALIAEMTNAVLALPEGSEFQQANPADGIALVSVTQLPNNRVRVAITGTAAPPTANLSVESQALRLSVVPGIAQAADAEDALQVVITGEQQDGYIVDEATTATRTDTPLRDIPQSIQVIPRQVLEDQQVIRLEDALRNVSGISPGDNFGGTRDQFFIRGFQQFNIFRDGFRDERIVFQETANIERIEVLKGPASVLFGSLEPGGIINIIPERPLSEPRYAFDMQLGNFGLVRPQLDFTGPLNRDGTIRYRLNALYERGAGFRDFDQNIQRFFVAPVLSWDISDHTNVLFEFEYLYDERPFDRGLVAIGDEVADIPRERILGEPGDFLENTAYSLGYILEHRFNQDWRIRNAFRFSSSETLDLKADSDSLDEETGILSRTFASNDDIRHLFDAQLAVIGSFATGPMNHDIAVGVDYYRNYSQGTNRSLPAGETPSLDIFDPDYEIIPQPELEDLTVLARDSSSGIDVFGVYLQDLISITDNLKLLLGGRFDFADQESVFNNSLSTRYDEAFNPRVGIVYQPIEPLSLYASFSRSFAPNFGTTSDGETLEPERGTQYEIGARAEFLEGRLLANLALYDLTKVNIADVDPNDPTATFYVAIGEQRSRGIELDVAGEVLPGLNLIASYAYTDAEITKGTFGIPDGNRPANVPEHSGSFWATYEIQQGNLQGLGFGLGLFVAGERQGDNQNTFELPGYVRTDAAIYYRRNNWRASLNVRNLFDVNYYEGIEYGRVTVKPGAPFTILGSISVEF
ncbi:TonB-dependent receptor [Leptolyngbya sp. NK1-12]|uniref:TonB-dependent receptor n=1 Tax=Leptolyngbya sp. NK1-12 TaxID=2547451 RepID=A0AA96WAT2_9CYAN|nr:TonB-dependent receptor [Leptolyngbya sp. NK1-12]WNZ21649.1 TonB-dependent receptor [Leptolyngbya sp. NK1-12]